MTTKNRFPRLAALLTLVVACGVFASGCVITSAGMSPSTHPFYSSNDYTVISRDEVSGRAMGLVILGIPVMSEPNFTGTAKTRAIKDAGADALVGVTIDNWDLNFFYFRIRYVEVAGTPVKFRG